jgi:5-methylcytosine-specific restriction endonuclease McrA
MRKGSKHTEETIIKLKNARKGKPSGMLGKNHSEETIIKISERKKGKPSKLKGRKHTEETIRKIKEARKKQVITKETGRKIALDHLGKKHSEETIEKMKKTWREKKEQGFVISEESKRKAAETRRRNNYKPTQETKNKISEKGKGRIVSKETTKKMVDTRIKNGNLKHKEETKEKIRRKALGRKASKETRDKMSTTRKAQGKNHPWYIGGDKERYYGQDWERIRKEILKRDEYTCQHCGNKASDVHHIDYDTMNSDPMNLVSLCKFSHGKSNNPKKRSYWTLYYQELMQIRFPNGGSLC